MPVSISTRFSVATGLLFQQASLGILNSNAHFNALKRLPPWSLCPPLPLLSPGSGRALGHLLKIIQVQTMGQPSTHSMPGCLALLQGAVQHHWEDPSQLLLPLWHPCPCGGGQQLPLFHPCMQFSIPALRTIFSWSPIQGCAWEWKAREAQIV